MNFKLNSLHHIGGDDKVDNVLVLCDQCTDSIPREDKRINVGRECGYSCKESKENKPVESGGKSYDVVRARW